MARIPSRLTVAFSARSRRDLGDIWEWNAERYGTEHADSYLSFLRRETHQLGSASHPGRPVESSPAYRYHVIRRRSRGYGHVAVFWIDGETLHVLRYFHTAQDWETQIAEPPG